MHRTPASMSSCGPSGNGKNASDAAIGGREADEPACAHPDETRGRPGSRVPHAWLAEGVSTIDCAANGFALLTGPDARAWRDAAAEVPKAALKIVTLDADAAVWTGIGPAGALLARPDGFVAWRAQGDAGSAGRQLVAALAQARCVPARPERQ